MFGGEPDEPHEKPGEEFAKGHYEQLIAGKGSIRVGDREWAIDGYGLRDHSWGPRYWRAPFYYPWPPANLGAAFGFLGSRFARCPSPGRRRGFGCEDRKRQLSNDFAILPDWTAPYHSPHPLSALP